MCESDVYFETYRHVYEVLKNFNEKTFPLRNYIIDVDVSFIENIFHFILSPHELCIIFSVKSNSSIVYSR